MTHAKLPRADGRLESRAPQNFLRCKMLIDRIGERGQRLRAFDNRSGFPDGFRDDRTTQAVALAIRALRTLNRPINIEEK